MDKMGIHYNVWIVLLSFALAATAAYSALNLISQVPRSFGKVRRLWLISGHVYSAVAYGRYIM